MIQLSIRRPWRPTLCHWCNRPFAKRELDAADRAAFHGTDRQGFVAVTHQRCGHVELVVAP